MTENKYIISEAGKKPMYRIDHLGMPSFYTRSWNECGKELSKLEVSEDDILFRNLKEPGKHMILAFFHANKILDKSKLPELERIIRKG